MIPQTFNEWKKCIEEDCIINLSKDFARQRLAVYQDRNNKETQNFIALYGKRHLQNIIHWFQQI